MIKVEKPPKELRKTSYFPIFYLDWVNDKNDPELYERFEDAIQSMQKRVQRRWQKIYPDKKSIIVLRCGSKVVHKNKTKLYGELYMINMRDEYRENFNKIMEDELKDFKVE